ncbi:hypothetical protein MSIMFI_00409 [Mycobacterium simulans]|nr:hypothetical protein MSIMFI_00409 [Mycobacterium simulans]
MASDRGADPSPANATPGADDRRREASPAVLCPKGHVNAWDYKFCERCGSPIGVVPWPSDELRAPPTTPARSRVSLVVVAATLAGSFDFSAEQVLVGRQPCDTIGTLCVPGSRTPTTPEASTSWPRVSSPAPRLRIQLVHSALTGKAASFGPNGVASGAAVSRTPN